MSNISARFRAMSGKPKRKQPQSRPSGASSPAAVDGVGGHRPGVGVEPAAAGAVDGVAAEETAKDETAKDETRPSLGDRFHQHLAVIVSLVVGTSIVVRVFAVAGYDPVTALALVQATGAGTVALGGLLASMPILAGVGCVLFARSGAKLLRHEQGTSTWARGLWLCGGAVTCALVMPVTLLIAAGLGSLALWVPRVLKRRIGGGNASKSNAGATQMSRPWVWGGVVGLGLAPVLLASFYFGQPWVPSEAIEFRGDAEFTGYVLSEPGDEVVVLRRDSRRIVRVATTKLVKRSLCRGDSVADDDTSLAALLTRGTTQDYPDCPE